MTKTSRPLILPAVIILLISAFATISFASTYDSRAANFASPSLQSSDLYTGYQVVGPYTTLRVEGSWIVPTANCTATPNSISNISVIIDGISGEGDAMEVGTYQDCTSGVASYGAFVNIYPMIEYYGEHDGNISNMVIHPGDVVEAQGTWRNSTTKPINWNTNIVDETTGVLVDTDALTNSTFTPVLNSGALILSSDNHTLTALSTVDSGENYTGVRPSDLTGPWRASSTFGETADMSGYSLIGWQMPGTTLSALRDHGSSFQVKVAPNTLNTTTTTTTTASRSSNTTTSSTASSSSSTSSATGVSSSTSPIFPVPTTSTSYSATLPNPSPVAAASYPLALLVAGIILGVVAVAAAVAAVFFRKSSR
jgi:hypothetical protein